MNINKETLKLARKWAEDTEYGKALEDVHAVREVIQALPDEIVDAAKVRELRGDLIESVREMPSIADQTTRETIRDLIYAYVGWIESLLPTPAPKVEVRMGAWAKHPERGKVLILSVKPSPEGLVFVAFEYPESDSAVTAHVRHVDLSPLPEKPLFITHHHWSEGNEYATGGLLAPEEEFKPGDMYRDKDGDIWIMHPDNKQWALVSREYGEIELPEGYAPYTKIEKP